MIKTAILLILTAGLLLFGTHGLQAKFNRLDTSAINQPVVVELFTSQGCSSCPPADLNLAILSEHPDVIALGFHVTYWDDLGWEDTLSQGFSTDRQSAYAYYKRNKRVYTPQMIINGEEQMVGSKNDKITRAIGRADPVKKINVSWDDPNTLYISLPEIRKDTYVLWVVGVKNEYEQAIASGENKGNIFTYKNAVIDFQEGGRWDGSEQKIRLNITPAPNTDRYVVLAQKDGFGVIRAAGEVF